MGEAYPIKDQEKPCFFNISNIGNGRGVQVTETMLGEKL